MLRLLDGGNILDHFKQYKGGRYFTNFRLFKRIWNDQQTYDYELT